MPTREEYFCWSDLASWGPLLDATDAGTTRDRVDVLLNTLYAGVRAFHGCKPFDTESYRRDGIVAYDREFLHQQVRDRIRAAHPEIDPALIERAIAEATPAIVRKPEVCAYVDRRFLVCDGREFCLQGSEMPLRVAARLAGYVGGVDVRQLFLATGTPTVIEFGADWEDTPFHVRDQLPDEVHAALEPARAAEPARVFDMPHVQFSSVPPEKIFAIEQPDFDS
jgi:hypothetical protein